MRKIAILLSLLTLFLLVSCDKSNANPAGGGPSASSAANESGAQSASGNGESSAGAEASRFSPQAPSGDISLVVLGDSIARGYGLKNVETERYSALLGEQLKAVYENVSVANYGVDGRTGAELVEFLNSTPPAELGTADAVIISIGGNNVLRRLGELLSGAVAVNEETVKIFTDYFGNMLATDAVGKSKFDAAAVRLNEVFKSVNAAFKSDDFNEIITTAAEKLGAELPAAVSAIRAKNPGARIIVQTVYNPYYDINISLRGVETPLELSVHGEEAVSGLNDVISSLAGENGYDVVDVHEAFSESLEKLTNAGIDFQGGSGTPMNFGVDPHPNAEGHKLIASLLFKAITEAGK